VPKKDLTTTTTTTTKPDHEEINCVLVFVPSKPSKSKPEPKRPARVHKIFPIQTMDAD
jgi:hypothetical protein